MQVLHLIYEPARSGISRHVLDVVRLLPEHQHVVVYPEHLEGFDRELSGAGAEPQPLPMTNKLFPRAALGRIPALIRSRAPDLVHLHALETGFFGGVAARLGGARQVVFTPQTIRISKARLLPIYRRLLRVLGRRAMWLAVSEGQERSLRRFAGSERVRWVPNSAPDLGPLPTRETARRRLGWPEDRLVVAQVSRLSTQKDPLTFVRAAADLPGPLWVQVGDGPLRGEVERAAAGLEQFRLPGFVDVREVYAATDVLVLDSRWEGMSLTLLGAMAAGLPVVASQIDGNTDLVLQERTGLLVKPGDPLGLRAAVRRLVADAGLRARLGAAGRAHVEANFSAAAVADRLRAAYAEVCPELGAPTSPSTTSDKKRST